MKIKSISFCLLVLPVFFACKKNTEPVDGNNATVELRNDGTKQYITGDVTVGSKDSLYFDFTISSSKEMGFVSIQKNPTNQTAFLVRDTLNSSQRQSYTAKKAFRADSANGLYIYRIVAHNSQGVYIGHRDVLITVNTDFKFFTDRFLFAPDTVEKQNKVYYSTKDGKTYSYSEGAAVSGDIDFGYFYDTTTVIVANNRVPLGHTIYALTASTFAPYDVSTWTKNATVFKKLASGTPSPTFAAVLSNATLVTAGNQQLSSGTTSKVTQLSTSSPHNTVYFKTAAGKVGMISLLFVNGNTAEKTTNIKIDVKVQK